MHGLCDKKILQSCFDEQEKASYNGLGLWFYYLFQISGVKWDHVVSFSACIHIFYYGYLVLVICKELLSVWQDDSEHLPSVSGERQIHSLQCLKGFSKVFVSIH